jgi:thiopeptide-type bacteriocin biosynthesis protein
MNASSQQQWLYLKIYLGESTEKVDDLLIELGRQAQQKKSFNHWFYIRYFDKGGFHIRFRVKPLDGQDQAARVDLSELWKSINGQITTMLPGQYIPMAEMPAHSGGFDTESLNKRIYADYFEYEPEFDKYGVAPAIDIAETIFCRSSQLACEILDHENQQIYSRKSLIPLLMLSCFQQLNIKNQQDYWRQYSQFWLGGDTPVAEDHREGFFAKGDEIKAAGFDVIDPIETLPQQAQDIVVRWNDALKESYVSYSKIKDQAEFSFNVLCFNFSHLMLNRLGLTPFEESYMAALLEQISPSE